MDLAEQAQTKLRRRRRWLIVTVVLVLVSAVSWWYWPRGDARFVGKWSGSTLRNSHEFGTFNFHSNGTALQFDRDGGVYYTYTWRTEGNELITGSLLPKSTPASVRRMVESLAWSLSSTFLDTVDGQRHSLTEVSSDRIVIKFADLAPVDDHLVLTRIPE